MTDKPARQPPFLRGRSAFALRATDERGFALLIVLWALAGLSLLTAMVSASAGSALRETRLLRQAAQMRALAEGGLQSAIFHAKGSPNTRWVANGSAHVMMFDGYRLTIRMQSEAATINPNTAPLPLVVALLEECGASHEQADTIGREIISWRRQAQDGDRNERQRYLSQGLHYLPPHAPFQTLGELALVPGMNATLLARLTPHLSIAQPEELHTPVSDPVMHRALSRSGLPALPALHSPRSESMTIDVSVTDRQGGAFRRSATILMIPGAATADDVANVIELHDGV
ncbi:general secretion pathway protein GspK [Asaia lannensis]|uniref:Type II secretion system protein GspK n=1 Tax=Asaia lannensis NBRC 102526 TaxID=1307926 RepID=A0ABT1CI82_9PROT|nr:type II secretion system protein GspK [Asaia lannensis]MCO6160564.1 type II secretion system protein GspK [Asaia lannensis NBRC 102526]GBQ95275.1 type III secretion component protein PulK [Asaia lannensis NBRC 102526]